MNNVLTREQVVLLVSDLVNGDIDTQRGEAQLLAHDVAFRQAHQQAVEALASLTEAAESVCHANNLTEAQQAVRVLNTLLYHQGKALATHKEEG